MTERILCLADAQAFYVSVERSFNSALLHRPVIVLSNADRAIVALSTEAKSIGLSRGMPYFQAHPLIREHRVVVFSSNYALYQNMSDRIFKLLSPFAEMKKGRPQIENYSIDESFLSVSQVAPHQLIEYGRTMREHVLRATGIPLRIAFGTTKQLTKVAAFLIKAHPEFEEVYSLVGVAASELDAFLSTVPVNELWGIGQRQAVKLRAAGISDSRMMRDADTAFIRRLLTVTGARIQMELRGLACIPLELAPPPRKGLIYSRGLGKPVETLCEMREVVANFTARAAKKLRNEHGVASEMSVFIMTSPFQTHEPHYSRSVSAKLAFPTNFTPDLIRAGHALLDQSYQEGFRYTRVGVSLTHILSEEAMQPDLLGAYDMTKEAKKARLMAVIDILNDLWSQEVVYLGTQGIQRGWYAHQQWVSPRFSTQWSELVSVQ